MIGILNIEYMYIYAQVPGDSSRPKVGEQVRITAKGNFEGKVGTLIKDVGASKPFKVKFTDNKETWFSASDVERVAAEETTVFSKGDKIEANYKNRAN